MTIHLYVKQHNVTGLKYFGVTTRKDPTKYHGSGKYWLRHLTKYGRDVTTLQIWQFEDAGDASEFAIKFSNENCIVESKDWANLETENALPGRRDYRHSDETKAKMSTSSKGNKHHLGHKHSDDTKRRLSEWHKNKTFSETHRAKIIAANQGKRYMTNGVRNVAATPGKVELYLSQGYVFGRTTVKQGLGRCSMIAQERTA